MRERPHRTIVVLLLLLWGLAVNPRLVHGQSLKPPSKPLRLPDGKSFPVSQDYLLRLRDSADARAREKIREHAWDLFAGLTGDEPVWETWYTKCQVKLEVCPQSFEKAGPNVHRLLGSFEVPLQALEQFARSPELDENQAQAAIAAPHTLQQDLAQFAAEFLKHPQFASVLFDQDAADHILNQCLYPRTAGTSASGSRPCPPAPTVPGKIKDFSRSSVVLKTVWDRVIPDSNSSIGILRTWKQELWDRIQKPGDANISRFQIETVKIDTVSRRPCEDRDYGDDEVIPISCFYAYKLTQADVDAIAAAPPDFAVIHDAGIQPGNYVVLVAMHVTTKEIPDWVWATFWWDNHGRSDPFAAGRPNSVLPRWRHFLMDTTLSGMTPTEVDGGPKISFNPYLETAISNGAISNCLQCHAKAAYGSNQGLDPYDLGILGRDGQTLASGNPDDPDYFKTRIQTDFLWSIANGMNPRIRKLLGLFESKLRQLQTRQSSGGSQDSAAAPKQKP
jgi:hypothetical protein